ncbi:YidH family protein [Pseudomonas fluorescens group sp. PF-1]|jgi:putative membrane protein
MSDLNDPRVFFAAERTLLAWNLTSLSLMAFCFVIERSGLLLQMLKPGASSSPERHFSFWIGLAFLMLGSWVACWSPWQHKCVVKALKPVEIPEGYSTNSVPVANVLTAALGALLMVYLVIL